MLQIRSPVYRLIRSSYIGSFYSRIEAAAAVNSINQFRLTINVESQRFFKSISKPIQRRSARTSKIATEQHKNKLIRKNENLINNQKYPLQEPNTYTTHQPQNVYQKRPGTRKRINQ